MADRLERNEQKRRDLLADVAHELRTPLSVIRGRVEGMRDGLYEADAEHLELIEQETDVLARLLGDLQLLSNAEAGALPLHRERLEPTELVEAAVAAYRAQADEAGIALETRSEDGAPRLDVDRVRIGEVLSNLIANAIRHTPAGGTVIVGVSHGPDEAVTFEVADTGQGIPADELPTVFDRFAKSPESRGAGLGLAIAKSLVQAHGGTISAESIPGRGTTIRFVLPAPPEA
jgi:two-component system OmpR family sensor kinase/two-component system sensor histidine kinase BaeS